MIDSHCHLNLSQFEDDFDETVGRALGDGVTAMMNIGYDRDSARDTMGLIERYPFIYGAVGVHPHDAEKLDDDLYNEITGYLDHPRVVAVGEIGLDFYRDLSPREVQRDVFVRMLRLARERGKPVVIHCRDAFEDVVATLAAEGSGYRGIFHAFNGTEEEARRVLDLGFHIGVGGVVTYRNSPLSRTVASIPLNRMVLETDSPYLTPHPLRGHRNEPAYVARVAREVASILKVTPAELDAATDRNYLEAMGIPPEQAPRGVYRVKDTVYIQTTPGPFAGLDAIDTAGVAEAVVCGFGEPLEHKDRVVDAARWAAERGLRVRLHTAGLGNMIAGADVTPELAEYVDEVVVAFHGTTAAQHEQTAQAGVDPKAFEAMRDFMRRALGAGMDAVCEFVAAPHFEAEPCREFARELGAQYDIRMYRS
jgi:TatD DNase family protein